MTTQISTPTFHTPTADVVGPYSKWPRNGWPSKTRKARVAAAFAGAAGVAVFVHCAAPMIAM